MCVYMCFNEYQRRKELRASYNARGLSHLFAPFFVAFNPHTSCSVWAHASQHAITFSELMACTW